MVKKEDEQYETGDLAPAGIYACAHCHSDSESAFIIPEMGDRLPLCPVCGGKRWYNVLYTEN